MVAKGLRMNKKQTGPKQITCPHCGSIDIGEYMYGLPIMGEELMEQVESDELILGGCCIEEDSPKYYCYHCEKDFGLYYKRKNK